MGTLSIPTVVPTRCATAPAVAGYVHSAIRGREGLTAPPSLADLAVLEASPSPAACELCISPRATSLLEAVPRAAACALPTAPVPAGITLEASLPPLSPAVATGIRLALSGPPGAGKTTHGEALASKLGIPHISVGKLLREEMKQGTDLGKAAQPYMEKGDLVPEEIAAPVLEQRLLQPDAAGGFILDGFPRRIEDIAILERVRASQGLPPVPILLIDVPDNEIMERVESRRVCDNGHQYDLKSKPPQVEGVCDIDGKPLKRRPDDVPEVVRHRLEVYHGETEPVLQIFKDRGLLSTVNGTGPIDQVALRIFETVTQMFPSAPWRVS